MQKPQRSPSLLRRSIHFATNQRRFLFQNVFNIGFFADTCKLNVSIN